MSKNFSKVRSYYLNGFWDKQKVYDAVGHWITADEYKLITGEEYIE